MGDREYSFDELLELVADYVTLLRPVVKEVETKTQEK